jgi:hypothetical protein
MSYSIPQNKVSNHSPAELFPERALRESLGTHQGLKGAVPVRARRGLFERKDPVL